MSGPLITTNRLIESPLHILESAYRPVVVSMHEEGAMAELGRLRSQTGVQVFDTFSDQVRGLMKARHPSRKLTNAELHQFALEYLRGMPPEEVGTWVYYSWRHSLVHLLPERDFAELRTSRNRYKITVEEQACLAEKRVGVVGLSVGAEVATTLAVERSCGELRLADFDVLELSNLNRLRRSVCELGVPKVILAARAISELDPFLTVTCFGAGLTRENIDRFFTEGGALDLVVEECDGLAAKLLCRDKARSLGVPVVMEANDRATLDVERFDLEPERPLLHGLLEGCDLSRVGELKTNEDKVPIIMRMVGEDTMSDKLRASLIEVGESIETWPQLASDVALGGALVGNVVRRILLGQFSDSGRYFVDLEELVRDRAPRSGLLSRHHDTAQVVEPPVPPEYASHPDALELSLEHLHQLVGAGVAAPSGANEQPWHWHYRKKQLWLLPRSRFGAALLNVDDVATHIALGAAAENVVLRAHTLSYRVRVTPQCEAAELAVLFEFFEQNSQLMELEGREHDALSPYLHERMTNRRKGDMRPLTPEQAHGLSAAVTSVPGCRLHLQESPQGIAQLAEVAGAAERLRLLHPWGHADFKREIRWTPEEAERTRDGIDLRSVELSEAEHAGLRMMKRAAVAKMLSEWQGGAALEKLSRKALASAAAVGIVTASTSGALGAFAVGRAIERMWLVASREGLALQPHTAAVYLCRRALDQQSSEFSDDVKQQLAALRARLRSVSGTTDNELFLFRVSRGMAPLRRALRRSIDDVLTVEAG